MRSKLLHYVTLQSSVDSAARDLHGHNIVRYGRADLAPGLVIAFVPTGDTMAFSYDIDADARLARISLSGVVRAADLAATIERLFRDPAWQYGFNTLWDAQLTTELVIEYGDLRGFLELYRDLVDLSGPGVDVLIASRVIDRVIGNVFGVMAKHAPRPFRVVDSEVRAMAILREARGGDHLIDLPPAAHRAWRRAHYDGSEGLVEGAADGPFVGVDLLPRNTAVRPLMADGSVREFRTVTEAFAALEAAAKQRGHVCSRTCGEWREEE